MGEHVEHGILELQESAHPDVDPRIPRAGFVEVIHPMGLTTKKDTSEVRPYVDCTIT